MPILLDQRCTEVDALTDVVKETCLTGGGAFEDPMTTQRSYRLVFPARA